jgi:hypothetical protein
LRATINAAIITLPRHRILILIVARLSSSLSRYTAPADLANAPHDAQHLRKQKPDNAKRDKRQRENYVCPLHFRFLVGY